MTQKEGQKKISPRFRNHTKRNEKKKMKTQTKNKQTAGSNMKYKEKKNASWEIVTKGKKRTIQ